MINVKQAIASAKAYAADVLGIADLLLEEVHSEEQRFEITLSFPDRTTRAPLGPFGAPARREYKTFNVNKDSGEVEGMSIRQIA